MTKLTEDVFSNITRTAYHKKRLGEMAPEIAKLDPIFSRYHEEKILNSMLDACLLVLEADSGSVMTLDKKTNKLHIKAASRLSDDIIDNTSIKLGDGIAGLAAATAKPIILPKDEVKNGIADKMKRRYIMSSLVLPFSKADEEDIYGVLNLNILRKEQDFTERDIAIIKELVNITSLALIPLQQTL